MNEEKKARRKNLLRSILTAAALFVIGLGLVGWSSYALELFTVVAGVYMVLSGLLRIRDAVSVKRAGKKGTEVSVAAPLILALIEIVCGVVCGLSKLILPGSVLPLSGVMLMIFGLAELVNTVFLAVLRRKAEAPRQEAAPETWQPSYQQDVYPTDMDN